VNHIYTLMNILKKIFGLQETVPEETKNEDPDNTQLIRLLNIYGEKPTAKNYEKVLREVLDGNGFLLLPTANDSNEQAMGWQTAETNTTLQLTSVFDQDGLKVLGAFSDEQSLLNWAKQPSPYAALKTKAITELCEQIGVGRIVINSGQKNMFVLERSRENLQERTIVKDTEILIGTPAKPLSRDIIGKLVENFKKIDTIEDAYQYAQVINKETSIVLGIRMSVISDNSKAALFNAVNDALKGKTPELPVDVIILNKPDMIQTAKSVENALFYSR